MSEMASRQDRDRSPVPSRREEPESSQRPRPTSVFSSLEATNHCRRPGEPMPQDLHLDRPGPSTATRGRPRTFHPFYLPVDSHEVTRMFRVRYRCQNSRAYPLVTSVGHSRAYTIRASEAFTIPPRGVEEHNTYLEFWAENGLAGIVVDDPRFIDRSDIPQVQSHAFLDRTSRNGLIVKLYNPDSEPMRVFDGQGIAVIFFSKLNNALVDRTGVKDPTEPEDRSLSRPSTYSSGTESHRSRSPRGPVHEGVGRHDMTNSPMGMNVLHPEDGEEGEILAETEDADTEDVDTDSNSSASTPDDASETSSSDSNHPALRAWNREYEPITSSEGEGDPDWPEDAFRGENIPRDVLRGITRQSTTGLVLTGAQNIRRPVEIVDLAVFDVEGREEEERKVVENWLDRGEELLIHPHLEEEIHGNGREFPRKETPPLQGEPKPLPTFVERIQLRRIESQECLSVHRPIPLRDADMSVPPPTYYHFTWMHGDHGLPRFMQPVMTVTPTPQFRFFAPSVTSAFTPVQQPPSQLWSANGQL